MIKTKLLAILLLIVNINVFSQTIQFVSEANKEPLSNVIVFNELGDVLTSSDIEGNIEKEALLPMQEKYTLVYDGYEIGSLTAKDLEQKIISLTTRVQEIEEVVIKYKKAAKYMFVRGNFNVYVLVNKQLNVYADGIVTYVFDNKTRKLKSTRLEQYRAFTKNDDNADRKKVASMAYDSFLEAPDLRTAGQIEEIKEKRGDKYKEIKLQDQTKFQYASKSLQDKGFKFLGYHFFDFKYLSSVSYSESSTNLRDFLGYNEIANFKLKHKSEPDFHQFTKHSTFLPTEISFGDDIEVSKMKLKADRSSYTFEYWKTNGFPNMQPTFSSFFKDTLEEKPNKAK